MIRGASENRSVTSWGPLGTSGEGEEWGEGGGLGYLFGSSPAFGLQGGSADL